MKHADQWTGAYRSFQYKVTRHAVTEDKPDGIWCYYIYVPLERLPESVRADWLREPEVMSVRHNQSPIMYRLCPDLDIELHCGCTYYQVHESDGNAPVAEIGCDYNHVWGENDYYDMESVERDCKHSIDCLWGAYPDMLRKCWYCHGYHTEDEGHETDKGWITFECEKKL